MTRRECFKRAAECNRLAETTSDPNMKLYLMRLALTWMQSATEAVDHRRAERIRPTDPRSIGDDVAAEGKANARGSANFSTE
jgi:hypothetical protein